MVKEYYCDYCDYKTTRKYCFERHEQSRKHQTNVQDFCTIDPSDGLETQPMGVECKDNKDNIETVKSSNEFTCEYCNKTIKHKKHKQRHYRSCKVKKITEDLNKKIKERDKKIEKLQDQKKELKKNYTDMIKELSKNHNSQNMFFIFNQFKTAYNYDDLMDYPLTDEEIELIESLGVKMACYYIIKNRCITDIDPEERPFHCIDDARNKFMLKNEDSWQVDHHADKIITKSCDKLRDYFNEGDYTAEEQFKIMVKMTNLELVDKPKIRHQLKVDTLFSNTRNLK